jgi:hypothetical protein
MHGKEKKRRKIFEYKFNASSVIWTLTFAVKIWVQYSIFTSAKQVYKISYT